MSLSLFEDQFSFFLCNPNDGKLSYVSKKFCNQHSCTKEELVGTELLRYGSYLYSFICSHGYL